MIKNDKNKNIFLIIRIIKLLAVSLEILEAPLINREPKTNHQAVGFIIITIRMPILRSKEDLLILEPGEG